MLRPRFLPPDDRAVRESERKAAKLHFSQLGNSENFLLEMEKSSREKTVKNCVTNESTASKVSTDSDNRIESEYIMRNAGLEETQAGIKIAGRNINNLRYADDTTIMAESEEELKSFLMKAKEESEKIGLKLNIQGPRQVSDAAGSASRDGGAVGAGRGGHPPPGGADPGAARTGGVSFIAGILCWKNPFHR